MNQMNQELKKVSAPETRIVIEYGDKPYVVKKGDSEIRRFARVDEAEQFVALAEKTAELEAKTGTPDYSGSIWREGNAPRTQNPVHNEVLARHIYGEGSPEHKMMQEAVTGEGNAPRVALKALIDAYIDTRGCSRLIATGYAADAAKREYEAISKRISKP